MHGRVPRVPICVCVCGEARPGCDPIHTLRLWAYLHVSTNSYSLTSGASVRNLGVTLDPQLSFSLSIFNFLRFCFMRVRDLSCHARLLLATIFST